MSRAKIPQLTETTVLTQCRRRCCLCYGLDADSRIKHGQIAHLDQNPNNNKIDNLIFLCFDHHNQYDSITSQSKGLTPSEVKYYKKELFDHINAIWNITAQRPVTIDLITGLYSRNSETASAELEIILFNGNQVKVKGFALYGKTSPRGPNIGDLDFISTINNNNMIMFEDNIHTNKYSITIELFEDKIKVEEKYEPNYFAYFGAGVSFGGVLLKQNKD
ncbi:hypothetical protein [Mucilaginibacter lappiensis]|uniref:HNH endonuclease n=1 Tax=Mucilaginibacter lappiensis TaxID=354630 RepID=A0A841JEJ9_9SPHI|nr:hypothetical protein [Mucilaginibacter lappiensis]MBB6129579.1 hypothetical protein [Mucilaginibacter lappiensis]